MQQFIILLLIATVSTKAADLGVSVHPIEIAGFKGRQSFALAGHGTKAIVIGGRLDGLHRRQPPVSFGPEGEPQTIDVIDFEQRKTWSAPVTGLPADLLDQWTSTNSCFVQVDSFLIMIGGYGIASAGGHRTHPVWSIVHVPSLIDAVVQGKPYASLISYGTGDAFAITGGRAGVLGDTIIAVGGHRFDGRYNPMGGSSFTQSYTNAIRKFVMTSNGGSVTLTYVGEVVDPQHLHRRDFNVVPQVFADSSHGYTAFSGVFKVGADLPYLDAVDIHASGGHRLVPDFEQYYAHYHCGTLPVYDRRSASTHTFFLGGIAQFRTSASGGMERNDSVPFVNTISRVTRTSDGVLREYRLADTLPGLLGAGAEVFHHHAMKLTRHGVIDISPGAKLDNTVAGWVIGGIRSTAPNIFWINDGTQSEASAFVAELRLHDATTTVYAAPSDSQRQPAPRLEVVRIHDVLAIRAYDVSSTSVVGLYDVNGRPADVLGSHVFDGQHATMQCSTRSLPQGTYIATVVDGTRLGSTLVTVTR